MTRLRLFFAFVFASFVTLTIQAGDNVLSATAATMAPGQTATISINLVNTDEVNGIQFDIVLPEGIDLVKDNNGRPKFTTTERTSEFTVMCKDMEKGRSRLMSFSFRAELVRGTEGVVFSVPVTCDSSIQPGNYTVRFTDACLSLSGRSKKKVSCEPEDFETVVTVK